MEQDEMKLILAEILEELKTLIDKKEQEGFTVDILQSKIKEAETLPLVLDKIESDISIIKAEYQNLPNKFLVFLKSLEVIKQDISSATVKLNEPIRQRVTHHHHLEAGLVVSIFLFLLLVFCIACLYITYQKANDYQERAYKYEYIRLCGDKKTLSYLSKTDSLFRKNKSGMIDYVDQENENLKLQVVEVRNNIDTGEIQRKKFKKATTK